MILQYQPGTTVFSVHLILGFFLALLLSLISKSLNLLTKSGSIAAFILAFLIFGFGGWKWTIPVLSFFIVSSLISRIREKKNPSVNIYFEKSGSRDFYQVAANGGLGGILVVLNYFFPDKIWFYSYSAIIASSCSDTWATEIGTLTYHNTYNIFTFMKVEPGSSGGVSAAGFSGALLGASFISIISVLWIDEHPLDFIILVTVAGFAASIFDTFIGETLQVQYKCSECKRIVDKEIHCGKKAVKFRGINFITNDFVNLTAGLLGGLIVFFYISLMTK